MTMDIQTVSLIILIFTNVVSLGSLIISFYTKRQFKEYDESVKLSAQNRADVEILKMRTDRLESDVADALKIIRGIEKNYVARFEEVKDFIAEQMDSISKKIEELGKLVTTIRINCAAFGHTSALNQD